MGTDLGGKTLGYVLVGVIRKEGMALYKGTFGMDTHTELGSFCKLSAFRRRSRAGPRALPTVVTVVSLVHSTH
jgi:hypothetical protein